MTRRFVARKRARFKPLFQNERVNIPWGTAVEDRDGYLYLGEQILCAVGSQNAIDHFSRDDDGNGEMRGKYVTAIQKKLADKEDPCWKKVWEDPVCNRLRQQQHQDWFIWDVPFYEAEMEDLEHIANLIGAGVK